MAWSRVDTQLLKISTAFCHRHFLSVQTAFRSLQINVVISRLIPSPLHHQILDIVLDLHHAAAEACNYQNEVPLLY